MATKICPPFCNDKHTATSVMMARIETKLDGLTEEVKCQSDKTDKQHLEILTALKEHVEEAEIKFAKKADKEDVDKLETKYWIAVSGVVSLLLAIIFLLLKSKV